MPNVREAIRKAANLGAARQHAGTVLALARVALGCGVVSFAFGFVLAYNDDSSRWMVAGSAALAFGAVAWGVLRAIGLALDVLVDQLQPHVEKPEPKPRSDPKNN